MGMRIRISSVVSLFCCVTVGAALAHAQGACSRQREAPEHERIVCGWEVIEPVPQCVRDAPLRTAFVRECIATSLRTECAWDNGITCATNCIRIFASGHYNCPARDDDGDGYIAQADGGDDCNDNNSFIHPGAAVQDCVPGDVNCNGIDDTNECSSPIVVDISGNGFDLTDAKGGVAFDLNNDGVRERLSWTAVASDDAWLALDRNGNGIIDNGRELFGNLTAQPSSTSPNGFLALGVFDQPRNGGNGDGVIDAHDSIYPSLRLWQDGNHNGVSETSELRALLAHGLEKIELNYSESRRRDQYGNWFRYRSHVYDTRGMHLGRWAWDVFLIAGP